MRPSKFDACGRGDLDPRGSRGVRHVDVASKVGLGVVDFQLDGDLAAGSNVLQHEAVVGRKAVALDRTSPLDGVCPTLSSLDR